MISVPLRVFSIDICIETHMSREFTFTMILLIVLVNFVLLLIFIEDCGVIIKYELLIKRL